METLDAVKVGLHPKIAKAMALIMVLAGGLSMAGNEFGLPVIWKIILFIPAVSCASILLSQHARIWHRKP